MKKFTQLLSFRYLNRSASPETKAEPKVDSTVTQETVITSTVFKLPEGYRDDFEFNVALCLLMIK